MEGAGFVLGPEGGHLEGQNSRGDPRRGRHQSVVRRVCLGTTGDHVLVGSHWKVQDLAGG